MLPTLETERLVIRPWRDDDAGDALAIYGSTEVTRWLRPALHRITDVVTMRSQLYQWRVAGDQAAPGGHWAVEHHDTRWLVGGIALVPLLAGEEDLSIAWQLSPAAWGQGFAAEAGAAVVRWVLEEGDTDEVLALVHAHNARAAATAKRIGMEWVGETEKYYGLPLQVYRIRHSDLAAEDPLPF